MIGPGGRTCYCDASTYGLIQEAYDQRAVGSQVSDKRGLGIELDDKVIGQYPYIHIK
jgi:L-alanine-DL-glutamate epimerase-like enolase superfamily enzyme